MLAHKRVSALTMKPKAIPRSEYLIDGHQVIFDSGAGWHCVCAEFTATDDCKHIRESQGRHAAQVVIANRMRLQMRQSEHRFERV